MIAVEDYDYLALAIEGLPLGVWACHMREQAAPLSVKEKRQMADLRRSVAASTYDDAKAVCVNEIVKCANIMNGKTGGCVHGGLVK